MIISFYEMYSENLLVKYVHVWMGAHYKNDIFWLIFNTIFYYFLKKWIIIQWSYVVKIIFKKVYLLHILDSEIVRTVKMAEQNVYI